MNTTGFRKELLKIMPGYSWTVHRPSKIDCNAYMIATGIISSGFNRLSTLEVTRREKDDSVEYEVKTSGYGTKSPWLSSATGLTLAQALRNLQTYYKRMAQKYKSHEMHLQNARKQRQ